MPPPQHVPEKPVPAIIQKETLGSTEKDIITACLIGEAGGEGAGGMQAVMNVIANRAHGDPHKFAQECLKPYQFSMFNDATVKKTVKLGDIVAKARKHPKWNEALALVKQAATKKLEDVTGGATHYHTPAVNPSWNTQLQQVATIGNHLFYKQPTKKKGAWDSTTNSKADPRTVPTQDGGMPVEDDKGSVAADEVQPESLVGPSEKRKLKYRPKEGPQIQVNTEPGNFPDIPYMNVGASKKQASEYDRNYSTMGDTQTSPYPKQDTVPVGSADLVGINANMDELEGQPMKQKKLKRLPERAEMIVVRNTPLSKKQAQEIEEYLPPAHLDVPVKIIPLEKFLSLNPNDEFASDSTRILPQNKNLRPALRLNDGKVAWGDGLNQHFRVMESLAYAEKEKYVGSSLDELLNDVEKRMVGTGFYDPKTKIYLSRKASNLRKAMIKPVDVDLPPDVTFEQLWGFLDDHYPLKYLIEAIDGGARVYTDEKGVQGLKNLIANFWEVAKTPSIPD